MKNKKVIISIILTSIVLIALVVISTTQAYFNNDIYAKNPTEYQSGLLSIEAVSKSNNISLDNTLPMSDDDGLQTTPYVFTIKNNGNVDYKFNIRLLSTSENTFSPEYIKLKIDDEGIRTFSSLTDSIIKQDVILPAGETIDISIRIWLSSDTKNTEIGKTFNSKIVIDGQSVYTSTNTDIVTPITEFTYFLGSEHSTIDTINYYNPADGQYYDVPVASIPLQSNEILLTKYNGTSKNVVVPNTYTIDDITYNIIILSHAYLYDEVMDDTEVGIFMFNENIESVYLDKNIKTIETYSGGEYIENSVGYLFDGCTSLVNAPVIPSSVTNMSYTFSGCTSLVNAPVIPSSVTDMYGTFRNCTNLTGIVKINSSNVTDARYIFTNTTKSITVQVPSGSTTYTTINNLTTSNGMPSNVTLTTY